MFHSINSLWKKIKSNPDIALESHGGVDLQEDRRVWIRSRSDAEVAYTPAGNPKAEKFSARVQDISRGGINLSLDRRFDPGSLLSVELPHPDEPRTYAVLACVVHLQAQEGGSWAVGCSFSHELDEDDLQAFGARREKPTPPDQRQWARFPSNARATVGVGPGTSEAPLTATVVNLSANGVGLVVAEPIPNGSLLNLQLQGPNGIKALQLLACVVRVDNTATGEWLLGCNFIRELSDEELEALV